MKKRWQQLYAIQQLYWSKGITYSTTGMYSPTFRLIGHPLLLTKKVLVYFRKNPIGRQLLTGNPVFAHHSLSAIKNFVNQHGSRDDRRFVRNAHFLALTELRRPSWKVWSPPSSRSRNWSRVTRIGWTKGRRSTRWFMRFMVWTKRRLPKSSGGIAVAIRVWRARRACGIASRRARARVQPRRASSWQRVE